MSDDDLAQLREELMVQKIMLDSLADAPGGSNHDDRDEIAKDIARIERLIARAERGEPAIEDDYTTASIPAAASSAGPRSQADRSPRRSPATPRQNTQGQPTYYGSNQASTPQQRTAQDPPSTTLSLRKRERRDTNGAEVSGGQNKSRRTTPPSDDFAFGSSGGRSGHSGFNAMDFIDLTGDDEYDAAGIADRIRETERRRQLEASPSRGPRDRTASQGQGNAFDRLMHTSRQNSGPMSFDDGMANLSRPTNPRNGALHIQDPSSRMPGAYNPSWDTQAGTISPGRSAYLQMSQSQPSFGQVSTPQGLPSFQNHMRAGMGAYTSGLPYMPSEQSPATSFPTGWHGPADFSGQTPTQGSGQTMPMYPPLGPLAGRLMGANRSSLSSIINQTSGYDFINGVDSAGNPLPDRMQNLWSQMHDPQVTEKELEDLLKNIRPDMDIQDENREKTPAGLNMQLYLHQELALSWLKKMEEGTNKGGILADDMGLGKTISMISLMTIRQATSRPKTNLIIAPVALMRQWEEEIRTKLKSSHSMSVFIYHGKKATTDDLLRHDVVLTTYGTLAAELKRLEKIQGEDRTVDLNDKMYATRIPLLHPYKAKFHRIILDEAQCIKNDRSLTARAAWALRGVHRWCLTGTPMMNGVHELYSLLKFLQIRPYNDKPAFTRTFRVLLKRTNESADPAMERLRVLLKAILLRRMKNTQINGRPIIDLPAKTEQQIHVELSPDEKEYYQELEKKSQVLFNKYLRENTVGKNYSNVLVLLLRLRQACCHPHLNYEVEDDNNGIDNEKSVRELDANVVQRIKALESFECPVCYDAVTNPSFFVPCGHDGCHECLVRIVDSAIREGAAESGNGAFCRCPECRTNFDPKQCFTYETFKKIHMPETVMKKEEETKDDSLEAASETEYETDTDAEEDDDVDDKGNLKDFIVDDDFWDDSDEERKPKVKEEEPLKKEKKLRKKKKVVNKGKGKAEANDEHEAAGVKPSMLKTLRKQAPKNRNAYKKYMAYLRKTWLPSAKVTECMKLLKEIQKTGEKTIIFSQWTLLLDLLEVAIYYEDLDKDSYRRYDGSMSSDERVEAARVFQDKKSNVKTILVSLRAGNAGLNLTAASRVIILDPFWNPYIEMQAVDRAYRIGQRREVQVYRILTKETVEDRIMELQEKKKNIVEAALDETESKKIARLSTSELRYLFNGTR